MTSMISDQIDIVWNNQVIQARVGVTNNLHFVATVIATTTTTTKQHYIWLTWYPYFHHHISIVNAYLFLVYTLLFIPACLMLVTISFSSELVSSYILEQISLVGVIMYGDFTMTKSVGTYNPVIMLFGTIIINIPHDKSNY